MNKLFYYLIINIGLLSIIIFITFCKKKEVQLPTISTNAISLITDNSAISGGNINNDGGAPVLGRGIVWSNNQQPTLVANNGFTTEGTGLGMFASTINGLSGNTTYYVCAYATNSAGTAYGPNVNFTTIKTIVIPTLTTTTISSVTAATATSGGDVTFDGGAAVTAKGVCWSTTANPTSALTTKTTDDTGTGSYTSSITGLTASATYHVRAYATNSAGTAYGTDISFATTSGGQTGTVTDIDGNGYNTVTIGTQIWMTSNLNTTKYSDGTAIPNVTVDTIWAALTTGAYCDYANTPDNSTTYGRLYNWYVAASTNPKNVCPTGWHVPSDAEWSALTTYLGGESTSGGKLKETGITHWLSPNTGATNETGFSALPGGYRVFKGTFDYIWNVGYWWSATEANASYAWYRYVAFVYSSVDMNNYNKGNGFSVRCLRDL
jgi:uncharacterized protein (TIGR02145 family)